MVSAWERFAAPEFPEKLTTIRWVHSSVDLCVIRGTQQAIPQYLLREHLLTAHGKKPSWLEEQGDDLRVAHVLEHGFHRADHELTEGLREPALPAGRGRRRSVFSTH